MHNHYFSEAGEYTESAPANPGALPPANALRAEPENRPGFRPVVNATRDGWDYVEDHRGEEGWLNGAKTSVTALGPLPEGWSVTPPEGVTSGTDPVPTPEAPPQEEAKASPAAAEPIGSGTAKQISSGLKFSDLVLLEGEEERFLLSKRGTYHAPSCRFANKPGEWLTREKIYRENPAAKPCGICRPNGRVAP